MHEFTKERLAHLASQHHMDGGGHEWTPCDESTPELAARGCVAWDDPDWDYLTGDRPDGVERGASVSFVWDPVPEYCSDPGPLPDRVSLPSKPGMIMRALSHGTFYPRDTECDCRGRPHEPTGAAGDSDAWEYTGNTKDPARPDCDRCEGTGYIDCDGGPWAVYATDLDPDYYAIAVGADAVTSQNRPEFVHAIVGIGPDAFDAADAATCAAVDAGLLCRDAADAILDRDVDFGATPIIASICVLWLGRR